jgi:hypothetical protein
MPDVPGIALAAAWASIGSVITRKAATVEAAAESWRNDRRDLGEENQGEENQGEEPLCDDMSFAPDFENHGGESTRFYAEGHRSETYSRQDLRKPLGPRPYRPPKV